MGTTGVSDKCLSCGCKMPDHVLEFIKREGIEQICENCGRNRQYLEEENEKGMGKE